ncbi:MAG TPA: TerB family tellurite resistance protein [Devosia sp.]|nr:TerB family tellurite resistance protein [Devosia sp.]
MFKAIANLFADPSSSPPRKMDPQLAVATLLVHLINIDGVTTDEEKRTMSRVLKDHFDLNDSELRQLLELASQKDAEAVDLYQFTSIITGLEMEQRIAIISLMWEVVFADGTNHEMEDNMIWRVAELIGVSSRDRTRLRAKFARAAKNTD